MFWYRYNRANLGGHMRHDIHDYFTLVYIIGWVVIAIGIFMVITSGFSDKPTDLALSVIFGGLFMTTFVKNSQLKIRIIELERELKK